MQRIFRPRIEPEGLVGGITAVSAVTGFGLTAHQNMGSSPPGEILLWSTAVGIFSGVMAAASSIALVTLPKTVSATALVLGVTYGLSSKAYAEKRRGLDN
jgi:hypothetical protein